MPFEGGPIQDPPRNQSLRLRLGLEVQNRPLCRVSGALYYGLGRGSQILQ